LTSHGGRRGYPPRCTSQASLHEPGLRNRSMQLEPPRRQNVLARVVLGCSSPVF
jgi:hypothetical protein